MTLTLASERRSRNPALPGTRPSLAFVVHLTSLVGASAVLCSRLSGQWFFFNEFEYLGLSLLLR